MTPTTPACKNPCVKHDTLEGSPVLAPFMREYANLIEQGFTRPWTPHNEKHRTVYYMTDDKIVRSAIIYGMNPISKMGWILFSFTRAEYQRQGLYRLLHGVVETTMREAGMREVASHVHTGNKPARIAAEKMGRHSDYLRMVKTL